MSALDRAFIRAYHRGKGDSPVAAPSATVPLSRALAADPRPGHPLAGRGYAAAASEPASTSIGALLDEAMQPAPSPASAVCDLPSEAVATTAREATEAAATHLPGSTVIRRFDPAATTMTTEAIAIAAPVQLPPPAQNVTTGSAAATKAWGPLLQVDRVVWPAIHGRFQGAAQAAIAQMTDGLQAIADSGRKIIGLASAARGEGVTTLLSAAARNLLERGRKVAVVDGHWNNPQLGRSLGLLPQIGWEESLGRGLPLEEVVIESLADGLAVLPVREPPASGITKTAIAAGLETLARKYDFVLVDLGALDDIADEGKPARELAARVDAVVLVQNVQVTPPNRMAEVRNHMAATKMHYAGTIQNFVAG